MCAQGATWAYDWTFGADTDFMQACEDNGVEYMPMIVRYIKLCCLWLVYEGSRGLMVGVPGAARQRVRNIWCQFRQPH